MSDLDPIFEAAGKEWNVDPRLLRAVAAQESGGEPNPDTAVSSAGAVGRMQITPPTARYLGMTDPTDPVQSIYGGAKYLSEALDREKSPEDALRYYHGGPAWRGSYGPESQGYVPAVARHYQQDGQQMPSKTQTKQAGDSPFDQALAGAAAAAVASVPQTSAMPTDSSPFDQALAEAAKAAPPVSASQPQGGGIARNIAAGATDVGANVINTAVNPAGTLGRLPATALVFAHDALAPVFGYERFPDDVRNALLNDNVPQPGNRLINAVGGAIGADPSAVPANTPAESMARKVTGGAGSAALMAPGGLLAAAAGGAGAATGDVAGRMAPAWAAPAAELAGNVVGGAAAVPVAGTMTGLASGAKMALAPAGNALARFVEGPVEGGTNKLTAAAPVAKTAEAGAPTPEPVPRSVGAAASPSEEAALTPPQVQAYRSTAEGQKLLEPQPVGVSDRTSYVPGVTPNAAEIEQSVNTARELKMLNTAAPDVSQAAKEVAAQNNDARQTYFQNLAGSDVDVMNAKAARSEQAQQDLAAAWGNKKPADATPVMELADQIKASPDGRRPVVRNAVDSVTAELTDKDGNLYTDPEQLYGVRKHIDDLMSKEASATDPKSVRAAANLQQIKDSLDSVIESAAPGFRDYLKNFSDASRKIDSMQVLQGHESKLYDAQSRMGYNRVQTMMRQIVDSRQAPGINPYKSLPDDTMQKLWALRDDLRRSASAQELARAPGSDTAQNTWDAARGIGKMGATAALHAGANAAFPVGGSLIVNAAQNALAPFMAGRAARRATTRGMQLLHPDVQLRSPTDAP
ncbi:MAG: lytic transglycosylase domain-containing protein [Nevskia sp.]|nr:lytic transglycosylase domain-containing protein [Nevskia sp.]